MRPLVVIPTYDEAATIATVLQLVRAATDAAVLVIDDDSPDGTAAVAEAEAVRIGDATVVRRAAKSGLGSAYRFGFRWGLDRGYDAFVEMDADLSHDPAVIPQLLASLDDADLVIGSRYVAGGEIAAWTRGRRALSRWGNRYAAAALRIDVRDSTSGFRAFRDETLATIDIDSVRADGYGFQVETTYRVLRSGGRVVEVPIRFVDRTEGSTKMSRRIVVEALVLVTWWGLRDRAGSVRGRRRRGTRASSR